jgi:hypothetical protein
MHESSEIINHYKVDSKNKQKVPDDTYLNITLNTAE